MLVDGLEDALDGEADDVAHEALDALDDAAIILLCGVGTGLVEGMDALEVGGDINFVTGTELYAGGLDEAADAAGGVMDEADPGKHLMDAATKGDDHGLGLGHVGRLAKDTVVEDDDGIGTEDKAVGVTGGDVGGLELGIEEAEVAATPLLAGELLNRGGLDGEVETCLGEEVAPTRRSGSQEEPNTLSRLERGWSRGGSRPIGVSCHGWSRGDWKSGR